MKKQLSITLLTLLLSFMSFFGLQAYTQAKLYETHTQSLVLDKEAKQQAQFQVKELAETLSLGYYKNEKKIAREDMERKRLLHKHQAERYTLFAILTLIVIFASYFFVDVRLFGFVGGLAALIVLIVGVFTPILMITISKEVEYLGEVALSFESKGILGSVMKLLDSGDSVVALVILLFSVIIPVAKTLSLMFISVFLQSRFAHAMVKFFKMIGKWSMVDVFVVATLLVYLTGSGSDVSHAEVEVGLYFFLAYVIVSMLLSLSVDRMLHSAQTIEPK